MTDDAEHCQRCGRGYSIVWAAEDDLWNEVTGKGESGLLCPDCFDEECNARGIFPFFVCLREHANIRRLVRAAKQLRGGLMTGPGQQVYIVGDHYFFTVEEFDKALSTIPQPPTEGE